MIITYLREKNKKNWRDFSDFFFFFCDHKARMRKKIPKTHSSFPPKKLHIVKFDQPHIFFFHTKERKKKKTHLLNLQARALCGYCWCLI